MTKTIDTLVDDIYALFDSDDGLPAHVPDLIKGMGEELSDVLQARLSEESRPPTLRMSNVGKGDRQLWYEFHADRLGVPKEKLTGPVRLKFLFGDIWESILLTLAEIAGHTVEHKQAEVELNGVVGHNDAIIDGVVVDVKSASSYAFQKFAKGTLADDDPFGYMEQIAAYCTAHGGKDGAFLVVDKTLGKLCLMKLNYESDLKPLDICERIEHIKTVVASDTPPPRCYGPVEEGKSGNEVLGVNCSYCAFKDHCWAAANDGIGLRTFLYSSGPKHFVTVVKEPKVLEITF